MRIGNIARNGEAPSLELPVLLISPVNTTASWQWLSGMAARGRSVLPRSRRGGSKPGLLSVATGW